jgi:hypothetical protein
LLKLDQRCGRIGDTAGCSAAHSCERRLRQSVRPKIRRHTSNPSPDLGRVAVIQRKRDDAKTSVADANVEIDVELPCEHVGAKLRKRHNSSRAQQV